RPSPTHYMPSGDPSALCEHLYTDSIQETIKLPPATTPRGLGRRLLRSSLLEALTYPHGVDRYVELVRPLLVKDVRAEITEVRHQTPKSVTLTLCPNENWRGLRAGQFVGVSVEIDGVRETRPYSPAGSEHAAGGALELTVSTHPDGKVSRYLRDHARPGMIVGLSQADGDFVLPDRRPGRVLLISGGSGVTPVMAMLRTLCDEGFVSFAASGRQAANSGLPLLEQAEDAGLAPDHGCRMGICNTCSCRKTAGTVRNVFTGETSSASDELIRICVSVPVGDVALDL